MKKNIVKISAVAVCIFISFTGMAQQAGTKPKVAEVPKTTEQDKTQLPATGPQTPGTAKIITATEQPKAIVPGGGFKPVDTDKLVVPNEKKQANENYQPMLSPVSKTAVPLPVVKEVNPDAATPQKPKPAPSIIKEQ